MKFRMMKRHVLAVVSLTAVCAWGYPTAKELEVSQPMVHELMAPAIREGKFAEAAASAIGFSKEAETEAAKLLFLRGAVELYARAGDDAKAAETFTALLGTVKEVPFAEQEQILLSAGRALSKSGHTERILALYREVRMRGWMDRELKTAQDALAKSPRSAAARLRAGNAYAVLGDWAKALEYLGGADGEIAPLAREDAGGEAAAEKLADGWWKAGDDAPSAEVKAAYRARAAAYYRKALTVGSLAGLRKTLAERRVEEAGKTGSPIEAGFGAIAYQALYCVVDLSKGPKANSYPVAYLTSEPEGWTQEKGWPDEYKTKKLVLRRVPAGAYNHNEKEVTLTKPFYIGIFEVTQKQYQLVMGGNPSHFPGEKRPVEQVSYDTIRGKSSGAQWPSSSAVDAVSFLGRLRIRTGLEFDLPTDAQWEYACRADTTTAFCCGDHANGAYMWYASNSSDQTHDVGLKKPNAWGLYDMHGNVCEWCLDWNGKFEYGTNPKGPSSGAKRRVRRGGSWKNNPRLSTSSIRDHCYPSNGHNTIGFRLVRNLSAQ